MRRTFRILTVTTVLVIAAGATALAGAIPVVTFDEVPTEFQAGTTHTVSFSILAHGKEPIDAGPTSVRFQGPDGGTHNFDARYDGEGRYTAEVILPRSGQWHWAVATGEHIRQDLGTISVAPADGTTGLLASLRVGLPIVTLLAVILLLVQLTPPERLETRPLPVTDVV
ncbi:MAG TPA: hypothetical protein VLA91_10860 [Acidimicrobiia bacterium]|nr:hypothetical protein [Acidimicrobiia bacterium]